jgi:hypothetical protein
MKIFYLFFLFIQPHKKNTNNYKKNSEKNMAIIYYFSELPNYFTIKNNTNNNDNNNDDNNDDNNDEKNNDDNNKKISYNIDGYDNRNITEEDNLHKIIKYNKIKNMLYFLSSNRSEIEKVSFINENHILKIKNNNIFNEDFDFFKKDDDIF